MNLSHRVTTTLRRTLPLVVAFTLSAGQGCGGSARYRPQAAVSPTRPPTVFAIVRSSLTISTREPQSADVVDSPAYRTLKPKIRKVAVAPPTSCANETAAQAVGQGSAGGILYTQCAVEMGQIERSLQERGYEVAPWRIMAHDNGRLPVDIAREQGAQILFQVNSLELQDDARGRVEASFVRKYYASDAYGTEYDPIGLQVEDVAQIEALIEPQEERLRENLRLPGAVLDVVAIDVSTSNPQNVWYYKWSRIVGLDEEHAASLLVRRDPYVAQDDPHHRVPAGTVVLIWNATTPATRPPSNEPPRPLTGPAATAGPPPKLITESRGSMSRSVGSVDALKALQAQALSQIITDFVSRFHDGTGKVAL